MDQTDFNFHNSNSSLLSFFKSCKSLPRIQDLNQDGPTEVQNTEVQTIENITSNIQDTENISSMNSIPKHLIQEVQVNQQQDNHLYNHQQDKNEHVIINNNHINVNNNNNNINNNNNTNKQLNQMHLNPQHISSNNISNHLIHSQQPPQQQQQQSHQQLTTYHPNNQIIPLQQNNQLNIIQTNNPIVSDTCNLLTIPPTPSQNIKYVDITEFLSLPQTEAAKKLGLPVSTLSKRWKEAVKERKWPYRKVSKLDKEITTLLYNIPQSGPEAGKLGYETEQKLGRLLRLRQEELKPVVIRI